MLDSDDDDVNGKYIQVLLAKYEDAGYGWMPVGEDPEYGWMPLEEEGYGWMPCQSSERLNGHANPTLVAPLGESRAPAVAVAPAARPPKIDIGPWPPRPDLVGQVHPASGWYDETGEQSTIDAAFRRDMLPKGWLGDMVRWAARATHCPPIFHVAAGLTYAAFELARRGWYVQGVGSETGPMLWAAILAGSGQGKSTSIKYLRFIEKAMFSMLPVSLRDPLPGKSTGQFALEGSGPGVLAAIENRVYETRRGEKRTCSLLVSHEMRSIFDTARKSDGFLTALVKLADQDPDGYELHQRGIQRGEDGGRKGLLPQPTLSAFFASSPAMLHGCITESITTGGFAGRFVWIPSPENWSVVWHAPPDPSVLEAANIGARLAAWVQRIAYVPDGAPAPVVCFDRHSDAAQIHYEWCEQLLQRFPEEGVERAIFCRLPIHTLRMACVLAVVEAEDFIPGRPIVMQPEHYQLAKNIAVTGFDGVLKMLQLAKAKTVQEESSLLRAVRGAGRRGLSISKAAPILNRSMGEITRTLRAHEELNLLTCATVRMGARHRPAVTMWAPEFAPPPSAFILDGTKRILGAEQYLAHVKAAPEE